MGNPDIASAPLRVGIVSRSVRQRNFLKSVLAELGLEVVADDALRHHLPDQLDHRIADVLLVNLDDSDDEAMDALNLLVEQTSLPILYHDSEELEQHETSGSIAFGRKLAEKLHALAKQHNPGVKPLQVVSKPAKEASSRSALHSVDASEPAHSDEQASSEPPPPPPQQRPTEPGRPAGAARDAGPAPDTTAPDRDDALLSCLMTLTKMLHRPYSADALVAGLPLEDNKLTPKLFLRAAQRADLSARLVKRSLDEISELVLPVVLLLKGGGACILDKKFPDGRLRVVQPESGAGVSTLAPEKVEQSYTGMAIYVRPAYRFDQRTEDTVIPRPRRWFWDTIRHSWGIYGEVILASFLVNLFALAAPLFVMNVYDRVVPNNAVETLWVLAIGMLIVLGFDLLIRTLRGYFVDVASKRTDTILSATLFERIMGIQLAARPPSVGAFANNLHEFDTFREFFTSTTLVVLIDLPFALLFVFVIWLIGGSLAWVPLTIMPLVVLAGFLIQIPLGKTIEDLFRYGSQKSATLIESLTGLETIKCMGAEGQRQKLWEQSVGFITKLGMRVRFLSASAMNITTFLQQMGTIAVVVLGVYMIADGDLTMGALVACTILTGRALAPLGQVAGALTRYHQTKASLHSVNQLMEVPLERPEDRTFLHRPSFKGAIEFQNVEFSYPDQPIKSLRGVSFKVEPGERVAIIGRIGSGKSTIGKLLLGLYAPDSGSILVDGTDCRQIDPADLRRNIGYVPQDVLLFYGNIKDNITLGTPYADDAAILRAADVAGVSDFTNRHPAGFDLQVGERGEALSGGQRQSVAVARSLINDPPILLMDEPTNAMDHRTEDQFKEKLSDWLEGKTLLLVTHRASLLNLVERIIVVDAGSVIADGPKAAVMEALRQGKLKVSE